jgi:hypothetical protein
MTATVSGFGSTTSPGRGPQHDLESSPAHLQPDRQLRRLCRDQTKVPGPNPSSATRGIWLIRQQPPAGLAVLKPGIRPQRSGRSTSGTQGLGRFASGSSRRSALAPASSSLLGSRQFVVCERGDGRGPISPGSKSSPAERRALLSRPARRTQVWFIY